MYLWSLTILWQWLDFVLSQPTLPQTISTSYGDDEQTGESESASSAGTDTQTHYFNSSLELRPASLQRIRSTWYVDLDHTVSRQSVLKHNLAGARGVSLTFSSGDGGVGDGDPDPATQECITNDGRNATRFIPGFPASCPL